MAGCGVDHFSRSGRTALIPALVPVLVLSLLLLLLSATVQPPITNSHSIQIFLPLAQGVLWTLAVSGWRVWNARAKFEGHSVGARIRRWWWSVNNWQVPVSHQQQSQAQQWQKRPVHAVVYAGRQ